MPARCVRSTLGTALLGGTRWEAEPGARDRGNRDGQNEDERQ